MYRNQKIISLKNKKKGGGIKENYKQVNGVQINIQTVRIVAALELVPIVFLEMNPNRSPFIFQPALLFLCLETITAIGLESGSSRLRMSSLRSSIESICWLIAKNRFGYLLHYYIDLRLTGTNQDISLKSSRELLRT